MRPVLSLLLLGLLVGPSWAAEDATDVTPRSSTATSTLNIIGPEEPIDANEEVYLRIQGLTLAEVVSAQDAQLFDLTAFPLGGVKIKASYDWMFRTLDLEFRAKHAGKYLVKLHLVREGKLEIAAIVITVGGVGPDPDPQPNPDPIPPPPGPLAEMWVIVVEESADRTPEEAWVLLDPTVRKWMTTNGHHLRIVDKDQTGSDLAEWIGRALAKQQKSTADQAAPRADALPYLFIVDDAGAVSFEGPLPSGPLQMLELVKKWGVEK